MKRLFALCLVLGVAACFTVGCEKKAAVTTETTVTTPEGSTTVKDTKEVTTTGENPPAAK
jgi:hypothetical protein